MATRSSPLTASRCTVVPCPAGSPRPDLRRQLICRRGAADVETVGDLAGRVLGAEGSRVTLTIGRGEHSLAVVVTRLAQTAHVQPTPAKVAAAPAPGTSPPPTHSMEADNASPAVPASPPLGDVSTGDAALSLLSFLGCLPEAAHCAAPGSFFVVKT